MSVFTEECFLFLRAPDGGVENLQGMKEAGFGGVFCNIKDYPAERWNVVRQRARDQGMFCGPWAHTRNHESGEFDPKILDAIITCADAWDSPLIVNSEAELKASGSDLTEYIAAQVEDREAAISMEPIPFANVDWTPVAHIPMLPQCFGPEYADAKAVADLWHAYGVKCVFPTFGTYSGWQPSLYPLVAPYSLYTGDDCGNDFKKWARTSTGFVGCVDTPIVPPDGGEMQKIGSQHGVTSAMNRLRTLDPQGTLLVADPYTGKWPPISSLTQPLDQWKAYDKLERSLSILVSDHDEAMVFTDTEEAPMGEDEVGTQSEGPVTEDEAAEVVVDPSDAGEEAGAGEAEEAPSETAEEEDESTK
jgi:hypothetical protein